MPLQDSNSSSKNRIDCLTYTLYGSKFQKAEIFVTFFYSLFFLAFLEAIFEAK